MHAASDPFEHTFSDSKHPHSLRRTQLRRPARSAMYTCLLVLLGYLPPLIIAQCPDYGRFSFYKHPPLSSGRYNLSNMRPIPACRTFKVPEIDQAIVDMEDDIADPDLYRLFHNTYPNTLDTAIAWKGAANGTDEELTFIITGMPPLKASGFEENIKIKEHTNSSACAGDINAMWLRDSANQVQSYVPYLKASTSRSSLASIYRGVINLQARYVITSPYCNSFQPPPESGMRPVQERFAGVTPSFDKRVVYECKYELDSLAAFLQVSVNYYRATGDSEFFGRYRWVKAVRSVMRTAKAMMAGTYKPDGTKRKIPYSYGSSGSSATEVQMMDGIGSPVQSDTGLIRSFFRPSDDSTIFQFLIPANMMFSHYLSEASEIMKKIGGRTKLARDMSDMADSVRAAITKYGIVHDEKYGRVYAYEVDGFGGTNMMDDANIPSLLAAPFFGYLAQDDPVYQNTRKKVLSLDNPYFQKGPVISAVGGPHVGIGYAWPMASIVRILTSSDNDEIYSTLKELVSSTSSLGLMHESISTKDSQGFSRSWFSWANGLFGQMIVDLRDRKSEILKRSFQ